MVSSSRSGSLNAEFRLCWSLLDEVSRSFALCIRLLPAEIGTDVMVSYLIARLADTIEDYSPSPETRKRFLELFRTILSDPQHPESRTLADWLCSLPATVEQRLNRSLPEVLKIYSSRDEGNRAIIRRWIGEMISGMENPSVQSVSSPPDLDRYCYYVAGTVGYLLTELFHSYGFIPTRLSRELAPLSEEFGLALQKVNIIKDLADDIVEGRCYWPREWILSNGLEIDTLLTETPALDKPRQILLDKMIDNATGHIGNSIDYILLIPETAARIRIFCLIPLVMAVRTLILCRDNPLVFSGKAQVKIPRREVIGIVSKSRKFAGNTERLKTWLEEVSLPLRNYR